MSSDDKLVAFTLLGQQMGLPIRAVKETIPERPLTRVFLMPDVVAGLINLRGEVVAVLDLGRLLGLAPARPAAGGGAVVLLRPPVGSRAHAAGRSAAGLLVERLDGVVAIDPATLRPPPPTLGVAAQGLVAGVAAVGDPPRPLVCLDPRAILGAEVLDPFRAGRAA